jgi:alpha-glucosidase
MGSESQICPTDMPRSNRTPGVFYQIYPRSFRDSNGDGIGDLAGIIEKLDYLVELGIDTVWLGPVFRSPQEDQGYDVSDFYSISQDFGTMIDFEALVKELHARGIKLLLDLVLCHTSAEHPWFKESAQSRDNAKRDWYIWRDGRKPGGKKPPNNWKAMTGGPAWRYFRETDQWVYFHFLPCEPDLNYRNARVKETMLNVMCFWLEKGVDGFRLDLLHAVYEDEELRDNPFSWRFLPSDKSTALLFNSHKYDLNLPETMEFAWELRRVVDEYRPERFLVGEVFGTVEELHHYCGPEATGLHMVFLFEFTSTAFKPHRLAEIIARIETSLPTPQLPTYVFGNHDRMRLMTRLGNNLSKAKLAATLQLTLRGVPFIYYGEEIGMLNSRFPLRSSRDPIARKYWWLPITEIRSRGCSINRDGCRTPMQWDGTPNAGFSADPKAVPWLRVSDSYATTNVETERREPCSLLNCYKRLISTRKQNPALSGGQLRLLEMGNLRKRCLAYARTFEEQTVYVYLNFSGRSLQVACPVARQRLLFSTRTQVQWLEIDNRRRMSLHPREGIVFMQETDRRM